MINQIYSQKQKANKICTNRTQSLLAIDNDVTIPVSDRSLETLSALDGIKKGGNVSLSVQPSLIPHIPSEEGMPPNCVREELPSEVEMAFDDFRDNALNIFYDVKEYAASKGARVFDECNFDRFISFCEDVVDMPRIRRQNLQSETRGKENALNDDLDALDPSY